ncbi:MAG TPA: M48 family metallopeptidase [Gemmataceae bacterium]|nr:M48 family metallopeptidase [Gemmataceae bacterium]
MPFVLMIFLTIVCLPSWKDAPSFVTSPLWSAVLTWLGVALLAAESLWCAWRVRRRLDRDPIRRDRVAAWYERRRVWRQFLLLAVFGLSVYALSWAWAAGRMWSWDGAGRAPIPGVKVLTLAPFFVSLVLSWVFAYDADRALYVAANRLIETDPLAQALLDGGTPAAAALDPAKDFGGRWSYVAFQGRQKLALVFLPVLLLIVQQEITLQVPDAVQNEWAWALSALGVAGVFAVLLTLPWMVRLALGLKPLPAGPTRDRLLAASRRLRFRCSDILLWNTRGGMANAMVIGVLPWPRYVIFTDRFLEEFNGDEVEAVFGHEVGHVKHQHMLFYLAFLMLSMAALGYGCLALLPFLPPALHSSNPALAAVLNGLPTTDAWMLPAAAGLLVYIFVVFGFLSRRCERQADVYGCRAVSCGRPDCIGHEESVAPSPYPLLHDGGEGRVRGTPRGAILCPTGVRTFIYALEKVAQVNGISRNRPGFLQAWQHGSIARRVAFLYGLIKDPSAERRFQRRVAMVKWGLIAVLTAVLAALLIFSPPTAVDAASPQNQTPAGAGS